MPLPSTILLCSLVSYCITLHCALTLLMGATNSHRTSSLFRMSEHWLVENIELEQKNDRRKSTCHSKNNKSRYTKRSKFKVYENTVDRLEMISIPTFEG